MGTWVFFYEFYCVEMAIFVAPSEVHLTEAAYSKTVVDLIAYTVAMLDRKKRREEFCGLHASFSKAEPIIEIQITIQGTKPNHASHDLLNFLIILKNLSQMYQEIPVKKSIHLNKVSLFLHTKTDLLLLVNNIDSYLILIPDHFLSM